MKQSWKLRCIFVLLCVGIVSYLGFKRNMLLLDSKQEYEEYQLVINEVMVNNRNSIRDEKGDFEGWIEIYNKGESSVNLQGFGLSNESKQPFLWTFPHIIIEPKSFCIVWTSGKNKKEADAPMHTNFKLKSKDKVIIFTSPNANWNDIFLLKPMGENISYGRIPDGTSILQGFDEGTPGKANINEIMIEELNTMRLEGPLFSHKGGFYKQTFDLTLETSYSNAEIYYTMDGSVPTKESQHYTKSISIPLKDNEATVVRARTYKEGYPKSKIITHSYFVDKDIYDAYNIPAISLVTDPKNLFDYEKGIYIRGRVFDEWIVNNTDSETKLFKPANYNQRGKNWEREASMELFEPDGTMGLAQNIGIRISGGSSRANIVKSLSLLARRDYDDKEFFAYDFFDGKAKNLVGNNEINQFSRILLRTSATDSEKSLFRDAFMQSLIQGPVILDTQSSKPCILYINGEYYGIRNIREASDISYLSNHYGLNQKDVVIIKNPTGVAGVEIQEGYVGDEMHYNRMITYVQEHDLKSESAYNYIKRYMDIDNFIEYNVLQIYCDNDDWPGNNVRIWRKRTKTFEPNAPYGHDGRWRWMVFDLDYGFGLFEGVKAAKNNSLERATEDNGPAWPNPPWSTLLLRSLLENDGFRTQFINVFSDRLNTTFSTEVVLNKIQAMEEIYYPNVKKHIVKWNLHSKNIDNWKNEIEVIQSFAIERPKYLRQHIIEHFGLTGIAKIRVEMNEGGIVKINSLKIEETDIPWEGFYFIDIPITVEAIPKPGFEFVGWEGINKSRDRIIAINPLPSSYLKAVFKSEKSN